MTQSRFLWALLFSVFLSFGLQVYGTSNISVKGSNLTPPSSKVKTVILTEAGCICTCSCNGSNCGGGVGSLLIVLPFQIAQVVLPLVAVK